MCPYFNLGKNHFTSANTLLTLTGCQSIVNPFNGFVNSVSNFLSLILVRGINSQIPKSASPIIIFQSIGISILYGPILIFILGALKVSMNTKGIKKKSGSSLSVTSMTQYRISSISSGKLFISKHLLSGVNIFIIVL